MSNTTERKIYREFKFKLTNEQIIHKAKITADLVEKVELEESRFTDLKKAHKETLKYLQGEKRSQLRKIRNGYEEKIVECIEVRDYSEGKIFYVYEGQIMEERAMLAEELQVEMPLKTKTEETKDYSVRDVIREETSRNTKLSAVDGPV